MRFETVAPPQVEAAGAVMTAAELHTAMALVDGPIEGVSVGFSACGGFDSCMAGQQLLRLPDRWLVTSDQANYGSVRCADEAVLRDLQLVVYRCTADTLAAVPADDTPVYLGFPRPRTRSKLGRHFMVPVVAGGPSVLQSMGAAEGARKYAIQPGVLSLWGDIR